MSDLEYMGFREGIARLTAERDAAHTALKTIERVLEQESAVYPVSVTHSDGTTHERTEREAGENVATMRICKALWSILHPFYENGTVPDAQDETARLTAERDEALAKLVELSCSVQDETTVTLRRDRDAALALLRMIAAAYADYRGYGVRPGPDAYQRLVSAIQEIDALLKETP